MVKSISDLHKSLKVSAAGMSVQNKRMLVISENLANANTKATIPGGLPYQRKTISFKNQTDPATGLTTVQVKSIGADKSPFKMVNDPNDPAADEKGNVLMPNVNSMMEMMDMREAGLTYEANLRAYEKTLRMVEETTAALLKN